VAERFAGAMPFIVELIQSRSLKEIRNLLPERTGGLWVILRMIETIVCQLRISMVKGRLSEVSFASLAAVLFALAPTLLFAYIGFYMRMMRDDYSRIANALEINPIALVMNYRNSWSGSFGNFFIQGLFGPLNGSIAQLMPALVIAIWLLGLIWLLAITIKHFQLAAKPLTVSAVVASLVVAATINGFYSLETLYWYTASTAYALPLALAPCGIALSLALLRRSRSTRHRAACAVIVALAAFATAGFSEMYLVFQLTALPFLGPAAILLVDRAHRRPALLLILIAWLATIACGLVQVTAPGIGERVEWYVGGGVTTPIRTLSQLLPLTTDLTFQYVTDQRVFGGFGLVFAAGLTLSLTVLRTASRPPAQRMISFPALPLWLGLFVQIVFVPLLWTHSSDSASILGRFSYAFFVVICLNAGAMLALLLLLLLRSRIAAKMRRNNKFAAATMVVCWCAALAFFALTQMRSIHYKAAGHLVLSALSVLALLSCMFASNSASRDTRRGSALVTVGFASAVVSAFVLLALANYSIGYVRDRVMSPISFLLVVSGMAWGVHMGAQLRSMLDTTGLAAVWLARCKLAGLLVVFMLGLGMFLGRLQWLPDLALYTREWDARHQYLLSMRAEGADYAEVAPLAYDMSQFLWEADISMKPENGAAERYYGIETIVQTEG
jgi:hypothetical protein